MTITVTWDDDDQTLIRYTVEGRWTWEEYFEASNRMYAMIESVPHAVCVIGDFERARLLPQGSLIANARKSAQTRHPRNALTVLVGINRVYRVALEVIRAVYPRALERIEVAGTVDEARALIREHQAKTSRR